MDRNENRAPGSDTRTRGEGETSNDNYPRGTALSQRLELLRHLKQFQTISTLEARRKLGIMSPASRIYELRAEGQPILTRREWRGIARYVLIPAPPTDGGAAA